MESGIYQRLLADSAVSAICANRIFPLLLPEVNAFPAISYQRISTVSDYTCDGPLGLVTARLQLDCWGSGYGDVQSLSAAVRHSLDGYTGTLPDGTFVLNIMRDNATDLYESAARLYRVQTDWLIQFAQQ